jgi:hypothetical protein
VESLVATSVDVSFSVGAKGVPLEGKRVEVGDAA